MRLIIIDNRACACGVRVYDMHYFRTKISLTLFGGNINNLIAFMNTSWQYINQSYCVFNLLNVELYGSNNLFYVIINYLFMDIFLYFVRHHTPNQYHIICCIRCLLIYLHLLTRLPYNKQQFCTDCTFRWLKDLLSKTILNVKCPRLPERRTSLGKHLCKILRSSIHLFPFCLQILVLFQNRLYLFAPAYLSAVALHYSLRTSL